MGSLSITDFQLLALAASGLGGLIWWQWIEHLNNVKTLKLGHYALKDTLKDDYWDKAATQQHIDLVLRPISQSLNAVAASNEKLTDEIKNLTLALAKSNVVRE